MKIEDLIDEVGSLPVEERAMLVDSLLRSLNPPESDMDKKWAAIARRRLDEVRSGTVETVPGERVFDRLRKRFAGNLSKDDLPFSSRNVSGVSD